MARLDDRNPDNAPGDWFIDRRCIDCGASPHVAPGLIDHRGNRCVFIRQPVTDDEILQAWRAVDICPTQSVGAPRGLPRPARTFPIEIATGVHLCGYNSPHSYGAHSWLVERPGGNLLIDSPRYTRRLHEHIDALGGAALVLLSHRDDVGDAQQWAERYGATVVIHHDDRHAAPFAQRIIEGRDPIAITDDVLAVPVPGHTRGSVVYLYREQAFTGDSLEWNKDEHDLRAFENATWYSWTEQRTSLRALAEHRFVQVFPGHGKWSPRRDAAEMRQRLLALVDRM